MIKNLREHYSPLYFLAALGPGGLAVSFYMYLMFMVPHPGNPMATADFIFPLIAKQDTFSWLILADLVIIVALALLHFRLLIWNIIEFSKYKETNAYRKLKTGNQEVSLMAAPLTYAMTINVCFVLGAVFVPGLWSVVEYLFPFALAGFLAVGIYAMRLFLAYATRLMADKSFDFAANNNLSQMIAIFAFSMIAVGLAAPGAMSHHKEISAIGIFLSVFFSTVSIALIFLKITLGFKAILEQGISREASVSLWIMVPILTLLGITFVRYTYGFAHNFEQTEAVSKSWLFLLTSAVLSLQIMFGLLGLATMKKLDYFNDFIIGPFKSVSSFAIICPGVAFAVFGFFFIHQGLLLNNVVGKFSPAYFVLLAPFAYVQFKTVLLMLRLNKKMLN
ncbi:MAG: hypothetical protein BWY57_00371 [Betaproteobacteria bacterium ADurb.Bin341]|nr:MAG: hypothetical protein BWY57_00371 [Betaproteobacteria bacterium ADurb.Bin341]